MTVIEGTARRRRWSREDKARIVAESWDSAVSVSAVAHRHGLNPNQLFAWRRQFRSEAEHRLAAREPIADRREAAPMVAASVIEVVIGAITVRVGAGVEAATLRQVLRVVRRLA